MVYKTVDELNDLSEAQLLDILVDNVCSGHETAEKRREIRKYYSLLPMSELIPKVFSLCNGKLYYQKPVQVTEKELKKREAYGEYQAKQRKLEELNKPKTSSRQQFNSLFTPVIRMNKDDELANELMYKQYVRSATVIAEGVIGIRLEPDVNPDKARKAIALVADKLSYKGDLVYG